MMNKLILSPEQKALQQQQMRISPAGQTDRFTVHVHRALDAVTEDVVLDGGQPNIEAALTALAAGQAYLLSQTPDRNSRRHLTAQADKMRDRLLASTMQAPADSGQVN